MKSTNKLAILCAVTLLWLFIIFLVIMSATHIKTQNYTTTIDVGWTHIYVYNLANGTEYLINVDFYDEQTECVSLITMNGYNLTKQQAIPIVTQWNDYMVALQPSTWLGQGWDNDALCYN